MWFFVSLYIFNFFIKITFLGYYYLENYININLQKFKIYTIKNSLKTYVIANIYNFYNT